MTHAEDTAAAPPSSSGEEPCPVLTLPLHVLQVVLGCLGAADVASAAMTCATLRQASRSEPLWRGLLAAKLGPQAEIVLPSALPDER
jgi:hypothetical protein